MQAVEPPTNQDLKDLLIKLFVKVEQIDTDVRQNRQAIEDLRRDVSHEIDQLKGDVQQLNGDVQQLNGDVQQLKGDFQQLKGDVQQLKSTVEQNQTWQDRSWDAIKFVAGISTSLAIGAAIALLVLTLRLGS